MGIVDGDDHPNRLSDDLDYKGAPGVWVGAAPLGLQLITNTLGQESRRLTFPFSNVGRS